MYADFILRGVCICNDVGFTFGIQRKLCAQTDACIQKPQCACGVGFRGNLQSGNRQRRIRSAVLFGAVNFNDLADGHGVFHALNVVILIVGNVQRAHNQLAFHERLACHQLYIFNQRGGIALHDLRNGRLCIAEFQCFMHGKQLFGTARKIAVCNLFFAHLNTAARAVANQRCAFAAVHGKSNRNTAVNVYTPRRLYAAVDISCFGACTDTGVFRCLAFRIFGKRNVLFKTAHAVFLAQIQNAQKRRAFRGNAVRRALYACYARCKRAFQHAHHIGEIFGQGDVAVYGLFSRAFKKHAPTAQCVCIFAKVHFNRSSLVYMFLHITMQLLSAVCAKKRL